jgi:ABC-type branched-subunit amino acid transport system permease subunit
MIVLLSLGAVPLVTTGYQTGLVVEFLILALFAVSYDRLIGYTGIVSFGHALPYKVGLYVFAIFATGRPCSSRLPPSRSRALSLLRCCSSSSRLRRVISRSRRRACTSGWSH